MSELTGTKRSAYVRGMFGRIAGRYDRLNRMMTFGQDGAWRQETIAMIRDHKPRRILDLGAGTGDLAAEAQRQNPNSRVVACDFVPEMIDIGIQRHTDMPISWVIAEADHLPFARGSFDAVVSGFLLRNLGDLPRALSEQARVIHPGGRFAALDTTPTGGGMQPLIRLHMRWVVPLLGRVFAAHDSAYEYLPDSTQSFLDAADLATEIERAGFGDVQYQRKMGGAVAIHTAKRILNAPSSNPKRGT